MKKTAFIGLALLWMLGTLRVSCGWAANDNAGTSSVGFLKLGLGARAVAMGGAFAGLADDVTAIHWNPAGLAGIDNREICFMHQSVFQDVSYEYAAYAQPLVGIGIVGAGIAYLHMDELTGRDESGEFTSNFTSSDVAVTLGYAFETKDKVFFGASIKYVAESIEDHDAHAVAFDLGWLYRTPLNKLQLGGAIQNLGNQIRFVSESCGLPRILKLGAAYRDSLRGNPINAVVDFYMPTNDDKSLHLGTEYVYRDLITARFGYNGSSDLGSGSQLSFGAGLTVTRIQTYQLDYSFAPRGALGDSHTISFLVHF